MKKILLLSLIAFAVSLAHSQTTIVLKDYSKYEGAIVDSTNTSIYILPKGKKSSFSIAKDEILMIENTDSFEIRQQQRANAAYYAGKFGTMDTSRKITLNLPSQYFKQAGEFGVTSVCFILGGGITGIVGAVLKNTTVAYVGAGVSGAGFVLLIPAFVKIHRGGAAFEERGW